MVKAVPLALVVVLVVDGRGGVAQALLLLRRRRHSVLEDVGGRIKCANAISFSSGCSAGAAIFWILRGPAAS